nr:hypothetical protein [Stenotrophomonas maltophilia]
MDDRLHKRGMAIAGLLVGLPTVAAGGTGAVLGLMVVWDGKYLTGDEHTLLLLWSSAGIIGLLSWLWLSGLFLGRGLVGLRDSPVVAWVGLALGGGWPHWPWLPPRCTSPSSTGRSRHWPSSALAHRCW